MGFKILNNNNNIKIYPLLQLLGGYFIMLSEDGKILYVSENVQNHTGYSQSEMMGHQITHFAHEDDHAKIKHYLSRTKSKLPESSSKEIATRGTRQFFHFRFANKRISKTDPQRFLFVSLMGHYRNCPNYMQSEEERKHSGLGDMIFEANTEFMFLGCIRPVQGIYIKLIWIILKRALYPTWTPS